MNCPYCKSNDYIQFVFVLHKYTDDIISSNNPSDHHWIYLCDKGHIYSEDQKQVWKEIDNTP